VLIAGPGTLRRRLHVQGSDFAIDPAAAPAGGVATTTRVARVSAK
jgi:hypothetical protein